MSILNIVSKILARRHFTELTLLESLIEDFGSEARVRVVANVQHEDKSYPLHSVVLGSQDPLAPSVGFFAGVHGLEKIGSEVVLAYMRTLQELMKWDQFAKDRLKHMRLVFMPLVNPVGIVNRTRSNGNGVDIMRNSPLDAEEGGGNIYRGHRISNFFPWYRGVQGAEMEVETKAMIEVIETELLTSRLSMAVDVHSGFGARDRFWFPYAHSRKPFPYLAECFALKGLFDLTYPHHFYAFEPMSRQYTVHGDPWDYVFMNHNQKPGAGVFIPFCLEMGSWMWLKKNPLQVFSKDGVFHPRLPHRRSRILRRHTNLFDFMQRAVMSPQAWCGQTGSISTENTRKAMELWYAS